MTADLAIVRTRWAAIGAAVAVTIGAVGVGGYNLVNADVSSGDRPVFVPIAPCRLADTRPAPNTVGPRATPIRADETISITAHGDNGECTGASQIPADAVALAMNVTALGATDQTFLTFWGDGDNPGTANLNPAPGQPPTPNAVNTPLSGTGTFDVYNERGDVDVVIDVNGYYAHHDHDDRYPLLDDVHTKDELYTRDDLYTRDELYTSDDVDALLDALQPDEIVLGATAFTTKDPSGDKWTPGATLFHASSATTECVNANVALPPGRALDYVEVVMSASNGGTLGTELFGVRASGGPLDASVFVDVFEEDIETDPLAGRTADFLVFFNGRHTVLDDYVYTFELCTADLIDVHAVKFHLD